MNTFVRRFQKSDAGIGALGAVLATSLGMAILAGGSRFYITTKMNESVTNELRGRAANIQGNAVALSDKLVRGGVVSEVNGSWQVLGTPPTSTWSFDSSMVGTNAQPVLSFKFCDPQKILSGAESAANCTQSVTASTTILGRQPSGKINLSNYSLVTKATKSFESTSGARVSDAPLCKEYNGTALVGHLFRSILAREPLQSELRVIMPCIARGDLLAWDLESANTGFCGGAVKGLRAYSEYDRRRESVYAAFRSNVGRMPGATDIARVNGYIARLSVPDSGFITELQSVAISIRADYALGTQPYSSHLVKELYDIVFQGAYTINPATNSFNLSLAKGDATLGAVVGLMRQAPEYRANKPGVTNGWAKHSEGVNFIYFALTGKTFNQSYLELGIVTAHPFDVSNWWAYHAWVVNLMRTDPMLNGYQWITQMLRYENGIDLHPVRVREAGICTGPAPRPQTVILSSGNISGTGAAGAVMTPGYGLHDLATGNFVRWSSAGEVTWTAWTGAVRNGVWVSFLGCYLNGSATLSHECKQALIPPTPGAARTFNRTALSFGHLDSWQYEESDTFVDAGLGNPPLRNLSGGPVNNVLGFQSISSGSGAVTIGAGGASLKATAKVTGPGGSNQFSLTNAAPAQKESCGYNLATRGSAYYHGPVVWAGQRVVASMVQIPAVALTPATWPNSGWGEYFISDASKRILDIIYSFDDGGVSSSITDRGVSPVLVRSGIGPTSSFKNPGAEYLTKYNYGNWGAYFPWNFTAFPTPQEPVTYTKNAISYQLRTVDTATTTGVRGSADCYFASATMSPLVLDLENNGVEYTSATHPVSFDLDGEGKRGYFWVKGGRQTPFLALDKNEDGHISDINELFGNKTKGQDGKDAANGFLSLAKYDSDRNGQITERDGIFNRLLLWFDDNENGISESNELTRLTLAGVKAIDLQYQSRIELNDNYGNQSAQRSVVEMQDGSLRMIFDIWFSNIGK